MTWPRRLVSWALETTLGVLAFASLVVEDVVWLLREHFSLASTFDLHGLEITEADVAKPDRSAGEEPPSRPGSNGVQKR